MKTQLATAVALALLTATGSSTALAGQDTDEGKRLTRTEAGTHGFGGHERMLRHMSEALDLDQTQRQSIENAISAAKPEMEVLHERARANRKALHELDVNDADHDRKLADLAREKGDITAEMAILHGRIRADIDSVLTPEQRQQLAEHKKEMKGHHQGKRRHFRSR